jgi:hypothetical protein
MALMQHHNLIMYMVQTKWSTKQHLQKRHIVSTVNIKLKIFQKGNVWNGKKSGLGVNSYSFSKTQKIKIH